jgi:hypothetical protein
LDLETGNERVKYFPIKNVAAVAPEKISSIRSLKRKSARLIQQLQALERSVIKAKDEGAEEEPGEYTAEIFTEQRGGKTVRRLHVRKRSPGEIPPMGD